MVVVGAVPYAAILSQRRGLLAREATVAIAVATGAAALLSIGLNMVLIPAMGLLGAALSLLCAYGFQQVAQSVFARKPRRRARLGTAAAFTVLASGATLASTALPVTAAGLLVRAVLTLLCLAWFGKVIVGIVPVRLPPWARHRVS